jgi:hypothetical protein
MPTIGFTLFISLFFVVGFGVLGHGIRSLLMSNQARTWPTTEGSIESCKITESSDSEGGSTYRAEVTYSYTVRGRNHLGDRIAFGYSGSSGRTAHQEIADRLSSAKTVRVRYDPADPSRAVLSYGLNRSTIFLLVFGSTWLLFVTGFTVLWMTSSLSDTGILNTLVTTR